MSGISSTVWHPWHVSQTVSRRAMLAGTIAAPALLAAGCSVSTSSDGDPDTAIRNQAAASEQDLINLYTATIAAYPALSSKLSPIKAQHQDHLGAMGATATSSASASPAVVAPSQSAAMSALVRAERNAAAARSDECMQATSQDLAWILTLVCASESQHAAELAGGGDDQTP